MTIPLPIPVTDSFFYNTFSFHKNCHNLNDVTAQVVNRIDFTNNRPVANGISALKKQMVKGRSRFANLFCRHYLFSQSLTVLKQICFMIKCKNYFILDLQKNLKHFTGFVISFLPYPTPSTRYIYSTVGT